jgi:outer membrane protein TolC
MNKKYFKNRNEYKQSVKFVTLSASFVLITMTMVAYVDANAQSLSLSDAVRIGLENNERVQQYKEVVEEKKSNNLEAWGNFLPTLNFTGSYSHLNDPVVMDLSPIRSAMIQLQASDQVEMANMYSLLQSGTPLTTAQRSALNSQYSDNLNSLLPEFKEQLKKQDYKTATLVAVQPLFTGGKLIAAKKYASAEKNASEEELRKVQNEVTAEIVDNYLAVVMLNDVIKTRQDVLRGMQRHREDAKRMFDEGLIANHHYLRAEVAVAEAERNLSDDQNKLSLAMLALRHSLGIDKYRPITISDSLIFVPVSDSVDVLKENASTTQPILQMIADKKIAVDQKYVAERAEFLPTVAAFGKYEMYPEYLSILEPRWVVGVQVSMNIFNGFKNYERVQSSVHLRNQVEHLENDTKNKIDLWLEKSHEDVVNARERYEKLEKNKNLAEENFRVSTKRFGTGLSTSMEVIDAQLSLEKILLDRENTIFEYYKSLTDLYLAAGDPQRILTTWQTKGF